MDALKEIQSKGDLMMEAIKDQKEVLINLRSELDLAEMRLDDAIGVTEVMEIRRKKAENERLMAENDTRMIDSKKDRLGKEIELLEKAKATTEEDLGSLRLEVGRLRQETEENEDEMYR